MRFIEDLRQQVRRKENALEEKKKMEVEKKTREEQIKRDLGQRQRDEENRQYEESVKHMGVSDFPRLTDEMISVVRYMKKEGPLSFKKKKMAGAKLSLTWDRKDTEISIYKVNVWEKEIRIEFYPNGNIVVRGFGILGSTKLSHEDWYQNPENAEKSLAKAYRQPMIKKWTYNPRPRPSYYGTGGGPCLPGSSKILITTGSVSVRSLKIGDYVWSVNSKGKKVKSVIVKKTKRPTAKNHKMVHIILKDGRELFVSPGHPTIDYKQIGSLVKGDKFDGSVVEFIKTIPYKGKYTYDILPYGDTGGYWANDILIGSTLSDRFQKTVLEVLQKPLYISLHS
jgi:hypothetical protein